LRAANEESPPRLWPGGLSREAVIEAAQSEFKLHRFAYPFSRKFLLGEISKWQPLIC
jgi:hypothetical protein